ncbi:right-handed parallel beta-helix repeat-containing protein [Opitutales bacterium]|nr:right-handed parallel beta-helix repeat-containing protein [Opitutales bacterium]
MNYPTRFILLAACCLSFVGCQPDPASEESSVQTPVPDEPPAQLAAVDESATAAVEVVKPEAPSVLSQRSAPKYLNYNPAPMGALTDAKGRSMQARIIAANDTQVRIQREDATFFTLDLAILSAADQANIRAMDALPQIDAEGRVVFHLFDFGAVGDGETDDGAAIRAAVAAAIQSGPGSVVVFDEAPYRMLRYSGARAHIMLEGVQGLTIEGNGATIIGTPYNGFLSVNKCERITMRGFVFDSDPLSFTQGDIVKADSATGELWLKLHPGYTNPIELTEQRGQKSWSRVGFTIEPDQRKLKPGPIDFIKTITEENRAEGLLHLKLETDRFSHINAGDRFVFGLQHGGHGAHIDVRESSDVLLEDYTIYAAKYGMNHTLTDNRGRVRVNGAKITYKPDSDRIIVNIKDGFHVKHNAIGPIIENSLIEGIMDDAINISVCPYWVKKDLGENRYLIAEVAFSPRKGDRLMAYTPKSGRVTHELQVLSVEAQTPPKGHRGKWNIIQLDQPIPGLALHTIHDLFPGGHDRLPFTGLYNLDACGKDFIVRNNTFLEQRRYALLARGVGGLFEGNTVNNNNGSGVMLCNEIASFYEGPFPGKITIRDNEFIRTGWESVRISVRGKGAWATDIVIEDNLFEGWPNAAMKLSNIDGLVVRNNTIRPGRNEDLTSVPIQISSSQNVQVEGNEVTAGSNYGLSLTKLSKLRVRANRFSTSAGEPMQNPVSKSAVVDADIDL